MTKQKEGADADAPPSEETLGGLAGDVRDAQGEKAEAERQARRKRVREFESQHGLTTVSDQLSTIAQNINVHVKAARDAMRADKKRTKLNELRDLGNTVLISIPLDMRGFVAGHIPEAAEAIKRFTNGWTDILAAVNAINGSQKDFVLDPDVELKQTIEGRGRIIKAVSRVSRYQQLHLVVYCSLN